MQELFIKKEKRRKKNKEKMDKCLRDLKQWVLRYPLEKKRERRIK
jgi:hypothetical protein